MPRPLVLIADHNPFVRKSVRKLLTEMEVEVREAVSGPEVLDFARNFQPDVIVLETNLPGPGFRSVLKALKGEDGLRHIPIIVMEEGQGSPEPQSEENRLSKGVQEAAMGVVRKPFHNRELLNLLNKALRAVRGITLISSEEQASEATETSPAPPSTKEAAKTSTETTLFPNTTAKAEAQELSESDFKRFQDFIMRKVGLYFDEKRKADLARALRHRMKALGIDVYLDYFQYLSHSQYEEKELRNLVLYLTIGETTFFRSPDQFKALREYMLPRLIPERRKLSEPTLRVWSAGCSTGEESYSIAITLREMIPDADNWNIVVNATDINQKFLNFADEGLYPARKVRYVHDDILRRYFRKEGDHYRMSSQVRNMVNFDYHNLSSESYDRFAGSDLIFCRNVLIYFRRDRIPKVIFGFHRVLTDDGYLVLGYSETLFQVSEEFKSVHYGDAFFYVKPDKEEPEEKKKTRWPDLRVERHPTEEVYCRVPLASEPKTQVTAPVSPASHEKSAEMIHDSAPEPAPKPPEPDTSKAPGEKDSEKIERERLWEEGLNYYFYEQFDNAEKSFDKLAELYPDCARAQLGLGFIQANKGNDQQAEEKVKTSLQMNNLLPEAYYLRALIEEKNGDVEAALADYRNVILLDPDFAMAHFNLGILYMKRNRIKDSSREFRNTLNILRRYETNRSVKFSGGLHREALIQLCEELSE